MTEAEIKNEITKAFELLKEQTWDGNDFTARMLQLVREAGNTAFFESYLANVMKMRKLQGQYWKGDKRVLPSAKAQEGRIDRLNINAMKKLGITNAEAFARKYEQASILFE